jgi:glucose-1-phosphate thymidylyltransferase
MQAVILAAGEGKRLRPLTRSRPKALIPIGNVPIIDYVIEALLACGIRDIIVVAGYRKEQVLNHLNGAGYPVRVVIQVLRLGTAHALVQAREHISGRFLVLPGDNYIDSESIERIMDTKDAVLVKDHPYPSNFGVVEIRRGYVTRIVEKPEHAPSFTIST